MLTVTDIYSVRFGPKLVLPGLVQDSIARLRITPAIYRPTRTYTRHNYRPRSNVTVVDNWREKVLVEYVSRIKDRTDPEYSEIFSIFNKVSPGNVEKLSKDAIAIIQKKDEQFRLRVATLMFDKAIVHGTFSAIIAESAAILNEAIPEFGDDIQSQIAMFTKLYNMTETLEFPKDAVSPQDERLVQWTTQKERRRGYARFMMELYSKGLISEESVHQAMEQVCNDLSDTAKQVLTPQTEENVTQFVTFLFECSKRITGQSKEHLAKFIGETLAIPRADLPSLNMRCRFKLEDAFKELNKKE